jgi:3'(2'), 5'-bisphosphate nucleotidase
MPVDMKPYAAELKVAMRLAVSAGTAALAYFPGEGGSRKPMRVAQKGKEGPVSKGDKKADKIIRAGLAAEFPEDGVVSEEHADRRDAWNRTRVWLIDPIDGTSEFIRGRPNWVVMIGLVEGMQPVLGVVYHPLTRVTWWGAVSRGAWLRGPKGSRRVRVSKRQAPGELRMLVSRSPRGGNLATIASALGVGRIDTIGSAGLKMATVASGRAELYVHPTHHLSMWDGAAGQAVLEAAGGRVTDMRGQPLRYGPGDPHLLRGLVASNGAVHEATIELTRGITPRQKARTPPRQPEELGRPSPEVPAQAS